MKANNELIASPRQESKLTVHVVQHLAPGGIESMALEMLRYCGHPHRVLIISLEGDIASAIHHWPKLEPYKHHLIFLNKPSGIHISTVRSLAKLFKLLKPAVLHTHHIGPLLYAGFAAKLTPIACHIHTEHDAWHLNKPGNARLQLLALAIAKPRLVGISNEAWFCDG